MDIPKKFLSKEFLSQFKTGDDVTAFMKELYARVYEQMLEGWMSNYLIIRSISVKAIIRGIPVMAVIRNKSKPRLVSLLSRFPEIGKVILLLS
jgi:hypothetical protein